MVSTAFTQMMLPPIHFYFYDVYACHFVHVCTIPTEAKEYIRPLKLELWVVVSHIMWVLEDQYVLLAIEQSL